MDLRKFTNARPLCFLASAGGVRDMALGIGYLLDNQYLHGTLLWQHYDELAPGYSAPITGVVFVLVGLASCVFAIKNWTKWTRPTLFVSALLWLFATLMYMLNGEWALGIYLSGYMTVTTGYISYYYKYTPYWQDQHRVIRDNYISQHDHLKHITERVDRPEPT